MWMNEWEWRSVFVKSEEFPSDTVHELLCHFIQGLGSVEVDRGLDLL